MATRLHTLHLTLLISLLSLLTGDSAAEFSDSLSGLDIRIRHRRASVEETVSVPGAIPENVSTSQTLYNLQTNYPGRSFQVVNNSAGVPAMFQITSGQLSLTSTDRNEFDYEKHKTVDVIVRATNTSASDDVKILTIRLTLSDVNDENPRFTNEPTPFRAKLDALAASGTTIFTVTVADDDTNPNLEVGISSVSPPETPSRFGINPGLTATQFTIVTAGSSPFSGTYTIRIYVQDKNSASGEQRTNSEITVTVGDLAPQFYLPSYEGRIYENSGTETIRNFVNTKSNGPLEIKVKQFQVGYALTYQLLDNQGLSTKFEIVPDASNPAVRRIRNTANIDYETMKSVTLTIKVTEAVTLLTATAGITINVVDENDNWPTFVRSQYSNTNLLESAGNGTVILVVEATDQDSGLNGELEFTLSNYTYFSIRTEPNPGNPPVYRGSLLVNGGLDYDNSPGPRYTATVMVKDKGTPPKSATVTVTVEVQNVNDNSPVIINSTTPLRLVETTTVGGFVTRVQATDIDGDSIKYYFAGRAETAEIFRIDSIEGTVTLNAVIPQSKDVYTLSVIAVDDNNCCKGAGNTLAKTGTSTLTINIIGVNANKPKFTNCANYDSTATVREKALPGTPVIQVSAEDPDRGEDGRVIYRIETQTSSSGGEVLQIDPDTGNITVKGTVVHGQDGYIQVTVVGRNPGDFPRLEGWCTFRVNIQDINDHAPYFLQTLYMATVSISTKPISAIRQMEARDLDVGQNAAITYSFQGNDTATQIFSIGPTNGVISLVRVLDPNIHSYLLTVEANDNGKDPGPLKNTTRVNITVNFENKSPPTWISLPSPLEFTVSESASLGTVITSLSCVSSDTDNTAVEYRVFDAAQDITSDSANFAVVTGTNNAGQSYMNLTVKAQLSYITKKEYQISLVCQNFGAVVLPNQINPLVKVQDANNQAPTFQGLNSNGRYEGTVAENSPGGATVIQVSADDKDETPPFGTVRFVLEGPNKDYFRVNDLGGNRAEIVTSGTLVLDREQNPYYSVTIKAIDGAPANPPLPNDPGAPNSAERFIDVRVTDVNDNPPTFSNTTYRASVSEKAYVNQVVFVVTANDPDETDQGLGLTYEFTSGNVNNAFTILDGTGEIKVARLLDYENPQEPKVYQMILKATDSPPQLHSATTTVEISVIDENDNRPVFSQSEYRVVNVITEEDTSITPNNPRFLVQVKATDADVNRTQTAILYRILDASGQQGPDQLFTIDPVSGNISLIGVLDREAGASPNFKITVRADDERINPLSSYADVVVVPIDINDNAPVFNDQYLQGRVNEETVGAYVTNVLASDKDEGENARVSYRVSPTQPSPDRSVSFEVSEDGKITTKGDPTLLDREKTEFMYLVVEAYDHGNPPLSSTATVTVTLIDINDQSPYFTQALYTATMSEALTVGVVLPVPVIDLDSDPKNKDLQFELRGPVSQTQNFDVRTNGDTAEIFVIKPVDYEKDPHFYEFDLYVTDNAPGHENTTRIEITVTDFNDNPPIFVEDEIRVTLVEERDRGEYVATFNATDADSGINAEFEFSVVRASDPLYEFYIDPHSGVVTTRKPLDREVHPSITVIIMAKDKGEIPLNSTARLIVTLTDINDNAPRFRDNYRPVVPENIEHNDLLVQTIYAIDPDTPQYGPPFGFKLPAGCNSEACDRFKLIMDPVADGGNGTATIRTSGEFDRELVKYYYLPIVMWDMRGRETNVTQTATNTLTIVIGDDNDNKHRPGHQDIHIYDYEGQFGLVEIGRVYAEDEDDWDLPDKTFTYLSPDNLKRYFSVDSDTGMVTINFTAGVPANDQNSPYTFKVNVYDQRHGNTETCTVSVVVEMLSDEAVRRSGGVRLRDITAEEFIKPNPSGSASGPSTSKYTKFRETLADMLGYPSMDNVEIVSLNDGDGFLDVRFSAHGSPYLNGAQMESAIMLRKDKFQPAVGVTVAQVPINLCMEEIYDDGCYSFLNVTGQPTMINSNGTSVVSVGTTLTAESGCIDGMFPDPVQCQGDYCYNGGTCIQDDWGKLSCACPQGFDGPRCQQRRHNFDGQSSAFYQGLSVCSEGRTSIDFMTLKENGLIMYSGPVTTIDLHRDPQDYLILELKSGYPYLRLNLGTQELSLTISATKLNDGKWHHLDIDRENQHVTLTVDHCNSALPDVNGTVSVASWDSCRKSGTVGGPDVLLNVQSLLQLGGRYPATSPPSYPPGVTSSGFDGCLRNLVHNTKLYDLYYKTLPEWQSGNNGCPAEEAICGEGTTQPVCGANAMCEAQLGGSQQTTCRCHPGWYGDKCAKDTPIRDFEGTNSFFKWQLPPSLITETKRIGSLQMMFRTRQTSGMLFAMSSSQRNILLQLRNGFVTLTYDMGQGVKTLALNNAPANGGTWHMVRVERYGNEFLLSMDGGEGRKYNYQQADTTLGVLFEVQPYVSAGGYVPPVPGNPSQVTDDLTSTCVQDIRVNDHWLPLTTDPGNNDPAAGATLLLDQGVVNDCFRNDCDGQTCPPDKVCYPLWEAYECRCKPDFILHGNPPICTPLCDVFMCYNGGICSVVNGVAVCECPGGWSGPTCAMPYTDTDDAGMHPGIIAAIVIGILLLIILIVVIILFCMRKGGSDKEKMVMEVDPDDDFIRENVMFYDEEGAGEEDHDAYDITLLQQPGMETPARPTMPDKEDEMRRRNAPRLERPDAGPRLDRPDVGSFIKDRIRDAEDDDPFADSTRAYNFEGGNSDAGSLSSLNTSSSGGSQDYDYLSDWGPKFAKLADMYGAGQNMES